MNKPFITSAPENPKWDGGYGSGAICPGKLAIELFGEEVPGPWLACYMLRRFGWPNAGSDDYKQFMSWSLTTPIKGLYLGVTPYLAGNPQSGSDKSQIELSFNVRFTKEIGRKIHTDLGRDAFFARKRRAIMRWWKTKGIKLYAWGYGLKEGDCDELVHKFRDCAKKPTTHVWGLWLRTKTVNGRRDIPKQAQMVEWWLERLIKFKHPEVKLPKMSIGERKRVGNPFRQKAERALKEAMRDLLRATYVRDVNFNCFGRTDDGKSCATKPKPKTAKAPEGYEQFWPGAGNTPAYWYSAESISERNKSKPPR